MSDQDDKVHRDEREKVITWLRGEADRLDVLDCNTASAFYSEIAKAIERGDHLAVRSAG